MTKKKMKKIEKMKRVPKQAFWRQILVLLPVYINVFMMGCTTGWVPNAIYFFNKGDEVSATPAESASIVSSTEIGRLLMAIPGGMLVDKFGRKKIIILSVILHFLSWLALSVNSRLTTLYTARFLLGVATAFVNAIAMISIGELASPEIRAKLTGIYQQFAVFGHSFQIIISAIFSSYYILSYCTLAVTLFSFIFLYWVIETPDYLVSTSQNEKALKNLKYIRAGYPENEINYELDNMKNYIENEKKRKQDQNWFKFMQSKEIRTPLLTVFAINFFGMATGFYALMTYITVAIPENEFVSKQYYPSVVFSVNIIISLLLPHYIEKFPRRILFMAGALGLSICFLVLSGSYFFYLEYRSGVCKWVFTFGYLVCALIMSGSVQPMISVLKAEILPQSVKGFGGSLTVVGQSMANIISIQLFNYILENFGLYYNFIIYAVDSLILFFLIYYLVPESRGKFLFDIQTESGKKLEQDKDQE